MVNRAGRRPKHESGIGIVKGELVFPMAPPRHSFLVVARKRESCRQKKRYAANSANCAILDHRVGVHFIGIFAAASRGYCQNTRSLVIINIKYIIYIYDIYNYYYK